MPSPRQPLRRRPPRRPLLPRPPQPRQPQPRQPSPLQLRRHRPPHRLPPPRRPSPRRPPPRRPPCRLAARSRALRHGPRRPGRRERKFPALSQCRRGAILKQSARHSPITSPPRTGSTSPARRPAARRGMPTSPRTTPATPTAPRSRGCRVRIAGSPRTSTAHSRPWPPASKPRRTSWPRNGAGAISVRSRAADMSHCRHRRDRPADAGAIPPAACACASVVPALRSSSFRP